MRVLITGSRDWRDVKTIKRRLSDLPRDSVIVHGAATGADHIAHSVALHLGMTPEPHYPDYIRYVAQVAPLERNKLMVKLGADLCLAFPTPKSRGTWHCLKLAQTAGIPFEVIEQEPLDTILDPDFLGDES